MRLATLRPMLHHCPVAHAAGHYTHQLEFDCPLCGPPHRIAVNCSLSGSTGVGVWSLKIPAVPSGDGWDGVTLAPSIANHHHGRKVCGYHCSIVNGDVLP